MTDFLRNKKSERASSVPIKSLSDVVEPAGEIKSHLLGRDSQPWGFLRRMPDGKNAHLHRQAVKSCREGISQRAGGTRVTFCEGGTVVKQFENPPGCPSGL